MAAPSEKIEESTVLEEFHDFSTSTDWERFMSSVEDVIRTWELPSVTISGDLEQDDLQKGPWLSYEESVQFASFKALLTRFYIDKRVCHAVSKDSDTLSQLRPYTHDDLMNSVTDFTSMEDGIPSFFGLRDYLVLQAEKDPYFIHTEDRAKMLLGSLYVVLVNTRCTLPIFVRYIRNYNDSFIGVCTLNGFTTHFDSISIPGMVSQCSQISEILNIFRSKMDIHASFSTGLQSYPVDISLRLAYVLSNWSFLEKRFAKIHLTTNQIEDGEDDALRETELEPELPIGSNQETVKLLEVSVVCSRLPEDIALDHYLLNSNFSWDLVPTTLKVSAAFTSEPECLLQKTLQTFLKLREETRTIDEVSSSVDLFSGTSDHVNAKSGKIDQEPKSSSFSLIAELLTYILGASNNASISSKNNNHPQLEKYLNSFKTTRKDSLAWRTPLALLKAFTMTGVQGFVELWIAFVVELRKYWDKAYLLPGIEPGTPNLAMGLLHQKLQMLNCCIARRQSRQEHVDVMSNADDEFYDCSGAESAPGDAECVKEAPTLSPVSGLRPEGRSRPCRQLKLLDGSDLLYIPVTQEVSPMTDDMLEEYADALLKLENDPERTRISTNLQSGSLLSDMQAFKAANPQGCFADFVRWYSPRDYFDPVIDSVTGQVVEDGRLSHRMQLEDNTWLDLWTHSKAVPVSRQKRLFDDTREAAKVLHFLEEMKPSDIMELVLPVVLHIAIDRIVQESSRGPRKFAALLEVLCDKFTYAARNKEKNVDEVLKLLYHAELSIARMNGLRKMFSEQGGVSSVKANNVVTINELTDDPSVPEDTFNEFLRDLLEKAEVILEPSAVDIRKALHKLFCDSVKSDNPKDGAEEGRDILPVPACREYILRALYPRPSLQSRPSPQRLYVLISPNEFRMAGAFTEDCVLY